ncbi:MAG: hypothetical protein NW226_07250 [Microscillaceae bacterium]|nr:hypothetical protein [Microscillaceae bacterium]
MSLNSIKKNKETESIKVALKDEKTQEITNKEVFFSYKNGHVFITQESDLLDEDFVSSGMNKEKKKK